MNCALMASDLRIAFGGNKVIQGVDVKLATGEVTGLVGPNGAGKTTLLNLLAGHLTPHSGMVKLNDAVVTGLKPSHPARRRQIRSYQDAGIFGRLSALENVMVPLVARGISCPEAAMQAAAALGKFGLAPVTHTLSGKLSGGQRKLVDFARCLAVDADVILLDEPTAGVHPAIGDVMAQLIRERAAAGTAFLIVSHDLQWVFEISDNIKVLAKGETLVEGPPAMVRDNAHVREAFVT